jgi:hypothetical protein
MRDTEEVVFEIDFGCQVPYFRGDEKGRCVLAVPPSLADEASRFFAASDTIVWCDAWEHFRKYGLKHPKHKKWFQGGDDSFCGQYILNPSMDGFTAYILTTCRLPEGHKGTHQNKDLEWTDDEADIANHEFWRSVSRAGSTHG